MLEIKPRLSFPTILADMAAALLICVGGCRSADGRRYEASVSGNESVESEDLMPANGALGKNDAQMRAFLKAAEDGEVTSAEVLKEALLQIKAVNNENAIVLLYLFLDEAHPCGGRLIEVYQDVRLKLASLLIVENRMEEAALVLQEYVDSPLADRPDEVREMLGQISEGVEGKPLDLN